MSSSLLEAVPPVAPASNGSHAELVDDDPEAELADIRQCSECSEPIGPGRSVNAATCSRECADQKGKRSRAATVAQRRPAPASRPPAVVEVPAMLPTPVSSSPLGHIGDEDPLAGVAQWLRHLPASITGVSLASGWRLERNVKAS
jgi:hypothetical protein